VTRASRKWHGGNYYTFFARAEARGEELTGGKGARAKDAWPLQMRERLAAEGGLYDGGGELRAYLKGRRLQGPGGG
jgi:hypothetical protein